MSKRLTIAIQKKGRLNQDSVDLITKSGISFSTNGERLLAKSSNFDIDIVLKGVPTRRCYLHLAVAVLFFAS